ncbi:MAG TPA: M28 family peptidase [Candidatus Thermoplasmatota archaeon]|nr:M28 family peptidase [Candidatus Thermoplasmatota archaeon]
MRRSAFAALVLAILAGVALTGCVSDPAAPAPGMGAPADPESLLSYLQGAPVPAVDGKATLSWMSAFVSAHKPRITGTPQEKAAGDQIAADLAALGYEVENRLYGLNGLPSADGPLRAVVGVKRGATNPDHLILMGAHYDTSFTIGNPDVPGLPFGAGVTLEAAYDNGSGTALVMDLARLLANVTTNKTLLFVLFNGEEEGLLASEAFAQELAAQQDQVQVETYMGFDMIGINYPSAAGCLCIYAGDLYAPELNPLQETVAFDLLGLPRGNETVQVFDNHKTRNSDEFSFLDAGFPTMRWAGMASAGDYWGYHKVNDTVETMALQAGGQDLLLQGLEAASRTAYYTVLALDRVELSLTA